MRALITFEKYKTTNYDVGRMRRYSWNILTPVEQKQAKKQENNPMETTINVERPDFIENNFENLNYRHLNSGHGNMKCLYSWDLKSDHLKSGLFLLSDFKWSIFFTKLPITVGF